MNCVFGARERGSVALPVAQFDLLEHSMPLSMGVFWLLLIIMALLHRDDWEA